MSIEGFGASGSLPIGPISSRASAALLPLIDALAVLGLPEGAGRDEASAAHRAALTSLQGQARAGTLDQGGLRAQVAQLDLAMRSIRAAIPSSGGSLPAPGASSRLAASPTRPGPTATPLPPQSASPSTISADPSTPTGVAPDAPPTGPTSPGPMSPGHGQGAARPLTPATADSPPAPAPTGPGQTAPQGQGMLPGSLPQEPETWGRHPALIPTGPRAASTATGTPASLPSVSSPAPESARAGGPTPPGSAGTFLGFAGLEPSAALKTLPLMTEPKPSPAQIELWNATVVPAAERHAETARALATAVVPRAEPLWSGAASHGALTLALAELSPDHRRALRVVATGVYEQLEAVLPRAVLAGLPPRDHLGLLPPQTWIPGADIKPALLLLLAGLVTLAVWASQR